MYHIFHFSFFFFFFNDTATTEIYTLSLHDALPIRVFSFEQMHVFAKAAGRYEAMARVFTDTGMRLGEVLPLRREDFDGEMLKVRRTAHEGVILAGTKTDHGE